MSAPKNNKFSQKGEVPATSILHIRVTPQEKAGWVRKAHPRKLSDWVREKLNKQ